jgi:two-component sensor histidine kinase
VFYFEAAKMQKNSVPPPVLIEAVSVNAQAQNISTAAGFDHDENNLSFTLNGMTFRRPNEQDFLYKLDGYDTKWQHSFNGNVQYTNLPPGAYTFMAYALNNDGVRSTVPARWSFVIRKPFWSTAWFIALISVLSLLLLYGLARWWAGQVRKREQEKTKMNKLLAEFQLTALRAQMNPHFIFNAISSIQHYILQNEVQQSYNYLAKFSKLIRNVLDYSSEDEILIANEIETLELYIELEQLRFREPFSFSLEVDPALDIKSLYIPTMLVQPFIENAIWHGLMPRKTPGLLRLSFRMQQQQLVVIIEDNGVGRQSGGEKSSHKPKGLSIIHQRIDVLNVKLDRQHEVVITDLHDPQGNPAGTRVELTIPVLHD